MRTTAAVLDERDGAFSLQELEIDEPRAGEVLVRVVASGICHTDGLARHGDLPFPLPGVLGHEGAGVVETIGPDVESVHVGDRVVIGWPWCGRCRNCLDGEPRYCAELGPLLIGGARTDGSMALRRLDGTPVHSHFFGQSSFATYALTTERALVPVPDDVPLELVGPLACGVSTGAGAVLTTVQPAVGSSLVVFGAGTVGLSAVMAARSTGATRVVAVDRNASRLALARELGATHTVDVQDVGDDVVTAVHDLCGGPADNALECTGNVHVLRQAADSVGMLGTCVLIGGAPSGAEFSLDHLTTLWGKRIVGVLGGGGRSTTLIGALMQLYLQDRFPFDRLVQTFPLAEVEEALAASYAGDVIKPVLRMPA